jgi:uncharacterized membrane protein
MRYLVSIGIFAAVLVAVAGLTSAPASAEFKVCNQSGEHISVAVAYYDTSSDSFVSEGWWNMDSGDCRTPVGGTLANKYYYVYAESGEHTWTGSHLLCLNPQHKFTLYDADKSCDYSWEKFFRVDTGDAESYTHTIR